jgi:YidC/Oxa1 family membrane protein insertase
MAEQAVNQTMAGGWVAILQHYFVSAWIPDAQQVHHYSSTVTRNHDNIIRYTSPAITLAAGEQGSTKAQLYVGPKDQYSLEEISAGLELTVDYGFLWWIAQPLFWVLTQMHKLFGNWGWAIIGVTVMVKAIFFHLNTVAYKSMANMRKAGPKMQRIKEMYGDDRQKMSQEMMSLYKKEKINPLGGCLPILVQMPVFIALYWVLMESVELRHAPWIGWIHDLSVMDPYYILPLIMGASMFIQQKLNPTPPDPMQAKVMQWMPVLFTFFFLFFPAGLVLYWVVNNVLSIAQQYVITKRIENAP